MSVTVNDIFNCLKEYFALELAEDFDNCGFLVGRGDKAVESVIVSLDITDDVIEQAVQNKAQLIVSHHPLFFKSGISAVNSDTPTGRRILALAENGIGAICMHTNADCADGGVNDLLAAAVGLSDVSYLGGGQSGKLGRIGSLACPKDIADYANEVKRALCANGIRFAQCGKKCQRVAVGGGSCGDLIALARDMGADTFITADLKYHMFKAARENKINLIDAGHFATENLICVKFREILNNEFPELDVKISDKNNDPTEFC